MSDFLRNLVTRSQTPLELVRPRVASIFEPAGPAPAGLNSPDLFGEQNEEVETDEEPRVATSRSQRRPPARSDRSEVAPEAPSENRSPGSVRAPVADILRTAVEAHRVQPGEASSVFTPPPVAERVIRENAPAMPPSIAAQITTHESREIREIVHSNQTVVDRELREIAKPSHEGAASVAHPAARGPVQPVQQVINRVQETLAAQPLTAATPKPEHVIHVSIGRVEVRAAADTPSTRKQRESPPVMSLDDYLRQRNKAAGR